MSKRDAQGAPVEDAAKALKAVDVARRAREKAEAAEQDAVGRAREAGVSWTKIGALYGLTKQGAQQRFKPASAEVVNRDHR